MADDKGTKAQIAYALQKSREAVNFDAENAYAEALDAYRECIVAMENILAKADETWLTDSHTQDQKEGQVEQGLTDADRKKIVELRTMYIQRVDLLLVNLPTPIVAVYNGSGFGARAFNTGMYSAVAAELAQDESSLLASYEQFFDAIIVDDPGILDRPEPSPSDPHHRSFWLMRLLAASMKGGGFLTNELYFIDVDVYQTNAVAQAVEEFEGVVDGIKGTLMKRLKYLDGDKLARNGSVLGNDGSDNASVTTNQTTSTKILTWGTKLTRGLSTLGRGKAEKVADISVYIELLSRIFTNVQFMEEWMNHFERAVGGGGDDGRGYYNGGGGGGGGNYAENQILERLRRISNFFLTVICPFVIKDFEILLDRYMKKMGQIAALPV
ncbi:hypothetical protein BC829DRAFT_492039 [Chytridium lagenaria]|nr:hypothetical protein BC829DRAFT_492039 [Chytridium lagenaria]